MILKGKPGAIVVNRCVSQAAPSTSLNVEMSGGKMQVGGELFGYLLGEDRLALFNR